MNREVELEICMRQLRELDEQELQLFAYERQAKQIAEDTLYDVHTMMMQYDNHDIWCAIQQDINRLENEFSDDIAEQKRQLNRQREALEEDYHKLIFEIEKGR